MDIQALSKNPRLPNAYELAELVDHVVSDWAFFSAQPAGQPAQGPAALDLEYTVQLRGPVNCLLVMRADRSLGRALAVASTGDPSAAEEGRDAFKELVNLVAGHLLTTFFGGSELNFEPFLPQPSVPAVWPLSEPDSQSVVMVEQNPLELRLWLESKLQGNGRV
jgi:hypothetical protein